MVAVLSSNPYVTTNAAGSFNISANGAIQGTAMDSPNARYNLAGGILAASEIIPMWGGVPITENIPGVAGNADASLGGQIGRATFIGTGQGALTGFSVFDQNYNGVNSPSSAVPLTPSYSSVNFYRLGSGARIWVPMDPSLVNLQGQIISTQVSWDFINGVLAPYTGTATYALTSLVWAPTSGGQITVVATVPTPVGAVGDMVNISGATNSGSGGNAVINADFTVVGFTNNQNFVLAAPAVAGVFGTIAGAPVLNYDTAPLPASVLKVEVGNSMTVQYNSLTNTASWERNGSCGLILV